MDGRPVRILLGVQSASHRFIGDIDTVVVSSSIKFAIMFSDLRLRKEEARPVGDTDIVSEIRSYLYCRVIMTVALHSIITEWTGPRVDARVLQGTVFQSYGASARMFEKDGFVLEAVVDNVDVPGSTVKSQLQDFGCRISYDSC